MAELGHMRRRAHKICFARLDEVKVEYIQRDSVE
jgi:hypothetical protein